MTYEGRNPSQYTEHIWVIRTVLCRYWLCNRKCIPLQETNNVKIYDCTFNRSSFKFTFNNRPQNTIGLFCPFVAPNYRFCIYYFTPFHQSQWPCGLRRRSWPALGRSATREKKCSPLFNSGITLSLDSYIGRSSSQNVLKRKRCPFSISCTFSRSMDRIQM